ncbi:hypothetical protein D910_12542 [Dendroctonus ponderosae]|uniref:Reverse transcriptase RNase H-like domain-containing protein n=1 Tax=Dendroctonus ponderosae TaxID=77166 RepID=U4UY21_DENPD|nr:hypothetical protein D910_12542 [Dendroctonus ponderosae]
MIGKGRMTTKTLTELHKQMEQRHRQGWTTNVEWEEGHNKNNKHNAVAHKLENEGAILTNVTEHTSRYNNRTNKDWAKIRCDITMTTWQDNWDSFLGTCNWLREHIPDLAALTAPLTNLLHGDGKRFRWTTDADVAFEQTKVAVAEARELSRPDFSKKFILQTDASQIGMSAVLYQEDAGKSRIISHASAKFTPAHQRYYVNKQQCLALVWGIDKYRAYLEDKPFLVRTDSRSLTSLNKFKDTRAKLTRWALTLQEFSFTLDYVPGKANQLPDLLSRYPETTLYHAAPDDETLHD